MKPAHGSRSLVRTTARGLVAAVLRSLLIVSGGVVGLIAASVIAETPAAVQGAADPAADRLEDRAAKDAARSEHVARLVAEHTCWTEEQPNRRHNEIPGHVVTTVHGTLRYSARLLGAALEHVYTAPRDGMVVHAFCP